MAWVGNRVCVKEHTLQDPLQRVMLDQIVSDAVIDAAYGWLCDKRQNYHHNNDVWQLRRWWNEKKPLLQAQLLAGTYRFREQRLIRGVERTVELWSAMDMLVLKAVALVLGDHLQPHLSERVFHWAGSGGPSLRKY